MLSFFLFTKTTYNAIVAAQVMSQLIKKKNCAERMPEDFPKIVFPEPTFFSRKVRFSIFFFPKCAISKNQFWESRHHWIDRKRKTFSSTRSFYLCRQNILNVFFSLVPIYMLTKMRFKLQKIWNKFFQDKSGK